MMTDDGSLVSLSEEKAKELLKEWDDDLKKGRAKSDMVTCEDKRHKLYYPVLGGAGECENCGKQNPDKDEYCSAYDYIEDEKPNKYWEVIFGWNTPYGTRTEKSPHKTFEDAIRFKADLEDMMKKGKAKYDLDLLRDMEIPPDFIDGIYEIIKTRVDKIEGEN